MNPLRLIARRLRALFHREKLDAEMSEEIGLHLELQEKENLARGMTPEAARYAAQRSFGRIEQVKECARDVRAWVCLEQFLQDVRYGFRGLRKNPGFTTVTILTFALGIGATTAVFTAINVLFLRPPPIREPGEFFMLGSAGPGGVRDIYVSFPLYERLRTEVHSGPALAALSYASRTMAAGPDDGPAAEIMHSVEVTGNFFPVAGIPLALGRGLGPEDDHWENPQPVVVLSHRQWVRRFALDPAVLGQTITLDGVAFTVVGVTARNFNGIEIGPLMDLWLPLSMRPRLEPHNAERLRRDENALGVRVFRRVQAPDRPEQIAAELDTVANRHFADIAASLGGTQGKALQRKDREGWLTLVSARRGFNLAEGFIMPLVIGIAVIAVLVQALACANVAGLLLARATARQREFALRLGLGCARGRLIRQVVTETVLLSTVSGLVGLALARWGLDVLVYGLFTPELVEMVGLNWNPDLHVFGFSLGAGALAGVIVGLVPAVRSSRIDLVTALKNQDDNTAGPRRQRLSGFLVISQITISVCLLAVAGLFIRTVRNLSDIDLGYNPTNLLRVILETGRMFDAGRRMAFALQVREGLAALPSVESATVADIEFGSSTFAVDGYEPQAGESMRANAMSVGPDWFTVSDIPVVRGRAPEALELVSMEPPAATGAPGVVVVTESFARKYFGQADPLGRMIRVNNPPVSMRVIGVTHDVRFGAPRKDPTPALFLPLSGQIGSEPHVSFLIRTRGNPAASGPDVRAALRRLAPNVPLRNPIITQEFMLEMMTMRERALAKVAGFFSVFGLLLSAVGLYGVLAYDVSRRTREIGVRMALGAAAGDVIRLVMRKGFIWTLAGAATGLTAAFALSRLVSRLLYGVSPGDPLTQVATAAMLLLVALLACWLPARRATKVDPMIALRAE